MLVRDESGLVDFGMSRLLGTAILTALLVYGVIYKWKRRHFERLASKLPGPPTVPLLGNGLLFAGTPTDIMDSIIKTIELYPSPFRIWIGPVLFVIISEPEDLQIVLNSNKTMGKHDMYKFFKNTVGEGLFSAPIPKWRKHRRAITPAFNTQLLEQFMHVFVKKNQILIEKMGLEVDKKKSFDLWKYIAPTALDIICQTALGYDLRTQEEAESEFAQALITASEMDSMRIYKPWLHPDIVFDFLAYFSGLNKVYANLHKLPMQVIQERKKEFKKQKMNKSAAEYGVKNPKAFLDTLLELNESGSNFTDDEIMDEVITMMIGGSETSALTNCYTLLMLAMHPEIQEKVYEEVRLVFSSLRSDPTIEDMSKLTYLEQCIKETLRLFPVGPLFLRRVNEQIQIKEFDIPEGASILISPIKTHRDPTIYPNPLQWNPDNFATENVEKRHRYSFIAFSGGPRGCIGQKYALLSIKMLISTVLLNFKLSTEMKMSDIKLRVDLLMRSVAGYNVKITKRN